MPYAKTVLSLLLVAGLAGCATQSSEEIEAAQSLAQQAMARAEAAEQRAEQAEEKAAEALRAAQEAQRCCEANQERINRAFEASMQK